MLNKAINLLFSTCNWPRYHKLPIFFLSSTSSTFVWFLEFSLTRDPKSKVKFGGSVQCCNQHWEHLGSNEDPIVLCRTDLRFLRAVREHGSSAHSKVIAMYLTTIRMRKVLGRNYPDTNTSCVHGTGDTIMPKISFPTPSTRTKLHDQSRWNEHRASEN
jgi:hypothetical protein